MPLREPVRPDCPLRHMGWDARVHVCGSTPSFFSFSGAEKKPDTSNIMQRRLERSPQPNNHSSDDVSHDFCAPKSIIGCSLMHMNN